MMDPRDVLKRPIITEKATMLMEQGKYVFEVDRNANKTQIKQAVEQIFNVKVTKVNTMRQAGKLRRQGRTQGRTREIKKAIVTLAEGQSIPIFEGL
ncbi:MAG: 50S ribosomal protein L23 [Bacillota bacterium]|nr:MAG: 50S ribosomal protein L23 [Bacillota bacterium]